MAEITEAELKKQMDKGEFARLYLLHGEEKYLLGRTARKLIEKAAGSAFRDFNLQKLDGAAASIDAVAEAVDALPLMAERKCVAVADLDAEARSAQDTDKLKELLESLPESTVLVIYLPTLEIDYKKSTKWKKLLTLAAKVGHTVKFERRKGAELEKLLCAAASKRSCELSRADAARITRICGNDLQSLMNELEKLCAYTGQGEISSNTIDLLVTKNLETTVFLLSNAIVAGNYDKAYSILDQLFYQNEEPVAVLAVLSGAYLDMYRVRSAIQDGKSAKEPAKFFDYRGKEFRLGYAERDAGRFSQEMLRESLFALLDADMALKGARGDRRIVMEKLLAKLLLVAEKERMA